MLFATAAIATLTQLVHLFVEGIGTELDLWEGLLPLSALEQLTQLQYVQYFREEGANGGWNDHGLEFCNQVGRDTGRVRSQGVGTCSGSKYDQQ
jgi:hypothetical protein